MSQHGETDERLSDRLLDQRGGLILGFPSIEASTGGVSELGSVRAYFFRVARVATLTYDPYDQIGSLSDGETVGFDYLGDTGVGSGDDIFRISRDDFQVYHFGVAPNTPDLRMYYSVDPQRAGDRAFEYETDAQDVSPGDDRGFSDGRMVGDRFDPPVRTERVAIRNEKEGRFLQFGFEATEALTATETELTVTGRSYKLFPVTDADTQDAMLAQATAPTHDAEHTTFPVTYHQFGGIQTWSLGTERPDDWLPEQRRDIEPGDF